jgi:hypothetical protein
MSYYGTLAYCTESTNSSRGLVRDILFIVRSLQTPAQARDDSSHTAAREASSTTCRGKIIYIKAYMDEWSRNGPSMKKDMSSTQPRSGRFLNATLSRHAELFTEIPNCVTSRKIASLQEHA